MRNRSARLLPGFDITLGYGVLYLSLVVLIPLTAVFFKAPSPFTADFWNAAFSARVLASYRLSFGTALAAAALNVVFGLVLAWCLVRHRLAGRRLVDAFIDLPFAMPTAVAGIALTMIYDKSGWVGAWLYKGLGLEVANTPIGILIALVFIGLPFVVRTVQPVLEELDQAQEEAATSLGAKPGQTFRHVIFPALKPALITGFALAFARGVGEYGSVIFIAGNIPGFTEITPLLIVKKLEQFDYAGASAIAVVMLVISFSLLFVINTYQARVARLGERNA